MTRNWFLKIVSLSFILMLALGACGGSDKKESSGDNGKSKSNRVATKSNSESEFQDEVAELCESVDQTLFSAFSENSQELLNDPAAFDEAVQAGEDELDRIISELDEIDAPAKYEDDWDTFIEDFSALRDAYPKLAGYLKEISAITTEMTTNTDPAALQAAQEKLTTLQTEIEALTDDLEQRSTEITAISDKLNISDCNFD